MSTKVIRALLVANAGVTALIPATKIVAGIVPEKTVPPAIGITEVSANPIGAIDAQASYSLVTSRVQVTAMTKDYPSAKALVDAVRKACNFASGAIAGISVASVTRSTIGPDMWDSATGIYFQSVDFMVTYHEQN
jgi:Protein of unknown function (DUF3168)